MKKNELIDDHIETITNNKLTWINIIKPSRDKINILAQKYPFHELNLEDCLFQNSNPKGRQI